MSIPCRKGYQVKESEKEKNAGLQILEENGFITVKKRRIKKCNKCSTSNTIPKNNIENYITCKKCRKKINISKTESINQISEIHYNKINEKITNEINSNFVYSFDGLRNCWFVNVNNKTVPILIPETSVSNFVSSYGEEEGILYIMLDKEKNNRNINSINQSQFIDFFEILLNSENFKNKILEITQTFSQNISVELEKKFDAKIDEIDAYQFETLCIDFLEKIKENQEELAKFYRYLSRKKNTLINSKIIQLGGAGNPDFHIIDLLDYLQSGFKPNKTGEVKRYQKTSRFTMEKFSKAILQGYNKPALFILSTNDIQLEVWKSLIQNSKDKEFPYVIIDKDLMLTLIKCLKLDKLLE